jgi:hypothetical protein
LGLLTVFVSSDTESIAAGEEWLRSVEQALENCAMQIILCSPDSITRPWINFEAGAAWIRKIPLIPICHSGLTPRDLPTPLSLRQAVSLDDPIGLNRLYVKIAEIVGSNVPHIDFSGLATELATKYSRKTITNPALEGDRTVRSRLHAALNHPDVDWRSLEALASEAGLSAERVADLLRSDETVRFSTGKSGNIIVGLKSRVGEHKRIRTR